MLIERETDITSAFKGWNVFLIFLVGVFTLIFSLSIAICVGAVSIKLGTVWGVLLNKLYPE